MFRISPTFRYPACGLLAAALIASGKVRRARRRALGGNVITSIYFHKPNKKLFSQCIAWLRSHGYVFVSASDVADFICRSRPLSKGAVWLSFDDGCREVLDNVLPLVRQFHIPVTLFIPSGIVEGDGIFPYSYRVSPRASGRDCMTVAELREISAYPEVTIASHTVNHRVMTSCTEEQMQFELGQSKRALEAWTGKPVEHFSYPKGVFDGRERRVLVDLGYTLAVTVENALITADTDPYLVSRFSVADDITLAEAICNMVGVWRPVMDAVQPVLGRIVPAGRISSHEQFRPRVGRSTA